MSTMLEQTKVSRTYVSVLEASNWSGLSPTTIRRLLDRAELTKFRIGSRVLVSLEQLRHLIEASAGS
jgi:excisionase family DNA binding protein